MHLPLPVVGDDIGLATADSVKKARPCMKSCWAEVSTPKCTGGFSVHV